MYNKWTAVEDNGTSFAYKPEEISGVKVRGTMESHANGSTDQIPLNPHRKRERYVCFYSCQQ